MGSIIVLAIIIGGAYLLCKGVKNQVEKRNAGRVALYIVLTIFVFWPAAVGQGIYVALKWNEPRKTTVTHEQESRYTPSPGSSADYERWKQEREK